MVLRDAILMDGAIVARASPQGNGARRKRTAPL
jgi:hypothetical protein